MLRLDAVVQHELALHLPALEVGPHGEVAVAELAAESTVELVQHALGDRGERAVQLHRRCSVAVVRDDAVERLDGVPLDAQRWRRATGRRSELEMRDLAPSGT